MKKLIITESQFSDLMKILNEGVNNKVDNFDTISNLLNITDQDKFFFIQLIKRWKDNKDKGMYKNVGDTYHAGGDYGNYALNTAFKVRTPQDLMSIKQTIIDYCDKNNARAYITSNPRSEQAINSFKSLYLSRQRRHNNGVMPKYAEHADEILAGQSKFGTEWPDRLRFFLDVDIEKDAYYIPRLPKRIHLDTFKNIIDDRNFPELIGCHYTIVESHSLFIHAQNAQQIDILKQLGAINVWDKTHEILDKFGVKVEMEYETPSKGLHIVIASYKDVKDFNALINALRIFDGGKDMGRFQTVHANMDGKIILYSNVDTKGY